MENEENIAKKGNLFKDLFLLREAIEVLRRRRGKFFNFGGGCRELIGEEEKISRELADLQKNRGKENE